MGAQMGPQMGLQMAHHMAPQPNHIAPSGLLGVNIEDDPNLYHGVGA